MKYDDYLMSPFSSSLIPVGEEMLGSILLELAIVDSRFVVFLASSGQSTLCKNTRPIAPEVKMPITNPHLWKTLKMKGEMICCHAVVFETFY